MTSAPRSKGHVFTLNNPSRTDYLLLDSLKNNKNIQYLVYQTEKSSTGTKHIQGMVYFTSVKTRKQVKGVFWRGMHVENMRGTPKQASDYCKKEDSRIEGGKDEWGVLPTQGARVDLMAMKDLIDNGGTLDDLWDKHFSGMVRYGKAMREYLGRKDQVRTVKPKISVFWGGTGTGKTWTAREEAAKIDKNFMTAQVSERGKFWWTESMTGRAPKVVIIDDFEGEIPFRILLQMLDRYECTVPYKGGFVKFVAKNIFITSNKHPEHWYAFQNANDSWEKSPLKRRLEWGDSTITEFKSIWNELPFLPIIPPLDMTDMITDAQPSVAEMEQMGLWDDSDAELEPAEYEEYEI